MSNNKHCPYCGRSDKSATGNNNTLRRYTNVNNDTDAFHHEENDGDKSWSCFTSYCFGKQSVSPRTNDVALNSEFNDSRAIYKRRATIQFRLEPVIEDVPHRTITYNKAQNSILKSKVRSTYLIIRLELDHRSYLPTCLPK